MTTHAPGGALSFEEVTAAAPPPVTLEDARTRIREGNAVAGRRFAVLDDDPTGAQCVHGVSVVTVPDSREYAKGLAEPGSVCFILTNTRSLDEPEAVALNQAAGAALFALESELGGPVSLVSRSDSTLRGHVIAEVRALDEVRRRASGSGYDGVLFVPAYFEAGRFTAGNTHWARVQGRIIPVNTTEFSRDSAFGYDSSDLVDFLMEKSGGELSREQIAVIGLDDIRGGGPDRVAAILGSAANRQFVVVNATEYADLEVVVLGLQQAQAAGKSFLHRCGPSFVRALAGLDPIPPLTGEQLRVGPPGQGHGLVVVGSHVGHTMPQLIRARAVGGLVDVELSVSELATGSSLAGAVRSAIEETVAALEHSDVLLTTSRDVLAGSDPAHSLAIARDVSSALVQVVRAARTVRPAWVIAKGGITSHDVAVHGLGIRRAVVVGQLFPGMVSVLRPEEAPDDVIGMPYVVFAGNVGDENALAGTIEKVRGSAQRPATSAQDAPR